MEDPRSSILLLLLPEILVQIPIGSKNKHDNVIMYFYKFTIHRRMLNAWEPNIHLSSCPLSVQGTKFRK